MAGARTKKAAKKGAAAKETGPKQKPVAVNRKARHLYDFQEYYEAGIELRGNEVKGVRESGADLKDSFVRFNPDGAALVGAHITRYSNDGLPDYEPRRERRLLLHRREINKIAVRIREKGYAAIPLEMYFKGAYLKLKFGVGRGKRSFDKKQALKEKDIKRQMERELKGKG